MASDNRPGHIVDLLLFLFECGSMNREEVIVQVGKHVRPNIASRIAISSRRRGIASSAGTDEDIRAGKRRLVLTVLGRAKNAGWVEVSPDGIVDLTKAGLDKLIQEKPQYLSLPLGGLGLDNHHLEKSVKLIKAKINEGGIRTLGLLEALRIIHRVVRDRKG